jgi:hypothetical protein
MGSPHAHNIQNGELPFLGGALDFLSGEEEFTYNDGPSPPNGTINKIERRRSDGTLAEVWRFDYNGGPVPPSNTIAKQYHDCYDVDGATLIVTRVYVYQYELLVARPFWRLKKVIVS